MSDAKLPEEAGRVAPNPCPSCGELSPPFMVETKLHRGDCPLIEEQIAYGTVPRPYDHDGESSE